MATAKKSTAKKAARKNTVANIGTTNVKATADKAVNVYLGLLGKGLDLVQENIKSVRKDSEKQVSKLEKRGVKLRKTLNTRIKGVDKDAKRQLNKVQKQVEDVVEDAIGSTKSKRTTAPKRRKNARKAA